MLAVSQVEFQLSRDEFVVRELSELLKAARADGRAGCAGAS